MKKAPAIVSIVRCLLNFKKPTIEKLHFAKVILERNAYFLITWKILNSSYLTAKGVGFRSRLICGSAYKLIPEDIKKIEIKIGNYWRSQKLWLDLETVSDEGIQFPSLAKPAIPLVLKSTMPFPNSLKRLHSTRILIPTVKNKQPIVESLAYTV